MSIQCPRCRRESDELSNTCPECGRSFAYVEVVDDLCATIRKCVAPRFDVKFSTGVTGQNGKTLLLMVHALIAPDTLVDIDNLLKMLNGNQVEAEEDIARIDGTRKGFPYTVCIRHTPNLEPVE